MVIAHGRNFLVHREGAPTSFCDSNCFTCALILCATCTAAFQCQSVLAFGADVRQGPQFRVWVVGAGRPGHRRALLVHIHAGITPAGPLPTHVAQFSLVVRPKPEHVWLRLSMARHSARHSPLRTATPVSWAAPKPTCVSWPASSAPVWAWRRRAQGAILLSDSFMYVDLTLAARSTSNQMISNDDYHFVYNFILYFFVYLSRVHDLLSSYRL